MCHYALRPPVTQERLHMTDEDQVRGRLAVLVPRPRLNLILYHGVLRPRAAWRPGGLTWFGARRQGLVAMRG
jgi:hypothetical protein